VKPQYVGTWRITAMETWDADYINLVGPGHLRIDRDGCGFMQFGAVEAALDCRVEDVTSKQRLEFTFQGFDEGDPVSGRGWATVCGPEMTGRICFHQGEESGFTAGKEKQGGAPARSTPKVIRLPKRTSPVTRAESLQGNPRKKIRYGQTVEINFSDAEKDLLEEYTLIDSEYMDRLQAVGTGKTWTGRYTLDDLEDMIGYIGEGESHAKGRKTKRTLQSLISRLNDELDSYDELAKI
jgi:hypothetical protein